MIVLTLIPVVVKRVCRLWLRVLKLVTRLVGRRRERWAPFILLVLFCLVGLLLVRCRVFGRIGLLRFGGRGGTWLTRKLLLRFSLRFRVLMISVTRLMYRVWRLLLRLPRFIWSWVPLFVVSRLIVLLVRTIRWLRRLWFVLLRVTLLWVVLVLPLLLILLSLLRRVRFPRSRRRTAPAW